MKRQPDQGSDLLPALLYAVYWIDESLQRSFEASGFGRTPRTWTLIMINLSVGVVRPSQIAKNLGVSRQAIHLTLNDMQAAGLVELVDDPDDGRARIVRFNRKADRHHRAATAILREIEAELGRRIGKQKLHALIQALRTDWGPLVVHAVAAAKPGAGAS